MDENKSFDDNYLYVILTYERSMETEIVRIKIIDKT